MKLFIISDDTRVTQETLFLNTISKFNNLDIVYCALAKRNDIDRGKYKNIELLDKKTIIKRLMLEKWTNIVFFNYYWNLNNFNFEWYKLNIFWHYAFYKKRINFIWLKEINFFNFYRTKISREKIVYLFNKVKINYISDINYPSSINYKTSRGRIYDFNYDILIPLWALIDFDISYKVVKNFKKLNFHVLPINHPHFDSDILVKKELYKFLLLIKWFKNVSFWNLTNYNEYSKKIISSKLILLPIKEHEHDLTRISDSLALGKICITNKQGCNNHIEWLHFFEWYSDLEEIINNLLINKTYIDKDYYNNIIEIYDKNHSIEKLTLDLYKFLINEE